MGSRKLCREHGSTLGRQKVKRIAIDTKPYPRPELGTAEGDASEIECPHCGLANRITDDVVSKRGFLQTPDDLDCQHCAESFDVTRVTLIVTVKARPKRG